MTEADQTAFYEVLQELRNLKELIITGTNLDAARISAIRPDIRLVT